MARAAVSRIREGQNLKSMATLNQTPEQQVRDNIDRQLGQAGWSVQDKQRIDWKAGPGVAVRHVGMVFRVKVSGRLAARMKCAFGGNVCLLKLSPQNSRHRLN